MTFVIKKNDFCQFVVIAKIAKKNYIVKKYNNRVIIAYM